MRILRLLRLLAVATLAVSSLAAQQAPNRPVPRVVQLDSAARSYTEVLGGPPASVTMESGQVVLAPGDSVRRHNTGRYEEVVIVLAGTGAMRIRGRPALTLRPGAVAYCPPQTEHDVVNTGAVPLRYLYVAARTPDPGSGSVPPN